MKAAGGAGTPSAVILEGTLGPEPVRPPLERSLESVPAAPAGSEGFVRGETQVLSGSGVSTSAGTESLPAESAVAPRHPGTESGQ